MSPSLVLGTHIPVSAALKPGSDLARIVERVLLRQVPPHVCPAVVAEYREVLNRPKFRSKGLPPRWLPRLLQVAFHELAPAPRPLAGPDPDDLVFLALAKVSGSVQVTGNLTHLPEGIRAGVSVLSPAAYLAG
jgi:predicted nucleic acid-binding protein